MRPLTGVKACVFDAYGTLFDTASAARRSAELLGDEAGPLAALWREKQLAYTWLRAVQGRHADFWQVTGDALDFALEALAIDRPGLRDRLMQLYLTLEPYPEVPEVLRRLRAAGLKTAILSNGTPRMLEALVAAAGLQGQFDALLSVEQAGVYKPHASVYRLALDALGLPAEAIAFQSSNGWDAYAASAFGMRVVWCNRTGQKPEHLPGAPDREVSTLEALPALVGA
ncbi:haloacid dehalogenase type II [Inquilinus limosus]|uniref:haloacid dehalogenase type II n=1 Tax=Inquilinus limosus TaxID=171674 RepID=UPI003F13AAD3